MATIHYNPSPGLVEEEVAKIQNRLSERLDWLDNVYGASKKLHLNKDGKPAYVPAFSHEDGTYTDLSPHTEDGSYCFFVIGDPVEFSLNHRQVTIEVAVEVVFFAVAGEGVDRLRAQIMAALPYAGSASFSSIWTEHRQVWKGYDVPEITGQSNMHPFTGLRASGKLRVVRTLNCT